MKKKTVIIISLIICLIVGILATISIEMDEASRRVETTETVKIVNGTTTPSMKVLDFEIKESGNYEFYLDWMIEKEGFISGINIVNEAGESVSCCTGDWAQIEMFPKQYEAGKYQKFQHYCPYRPRKIHPGRSTHRKNRSGGSERYEGPVPGQYGSRKRTRNYDQASDNPSCL